METDNNIRVKTASDADIDASLQKLLNSISEENKLPLQSDPILVCDTETEALLNTLAKLERQARIYIAQKRRKRNARVPISRLPKELLVIIFTHVLDNLDRVEFFAFNTLYADRLKLLQTCWWWSTVIYGSSVFWTPVSSTCASDTIDSILRHAAGRPLEISYKTPVKKPFRPAISQELAQKNAMMFLGKVREELHRWRAARMEISVSVQDIILPLLLQPAALIERFRLQGNWRLTGSSKRLNLFGGMAPNLVHLAIKEAHIDFGSLRFPALQELELWAIPGSDALLSHFLSFLQGSNALRELEITSASFIVDVDDELHGVELPNLRRLHLDMLEPDLLRALCRGIRSLPACQELHVDCSSGDEAMPFDDILEQALGHLASDVRRMIKTGQDVDKVEIVISGGELNIHTSGTSVSVGIRGDIPVVETMRWLRGILAEIDGPMPVHVDTFDDCPDWSTTGFTEALNGMHVVEIDAEVDRDGYPALLEDLEMPAMINEQGVIWRFPHLKNLSISTRDLPIEGEALLRLLKARYGVSEKCNTTSGSVPWPRDKNLPIPVQLRITSGRISRRVRDEISALVGPGAVADVVEVVDDDETYDDDHMDEDAGDSDQEMDE